MASRIPPDSLTSLGHGLNRPECVLTHVSGMLFCADWQGPGGIAVVTPEGAVRRLEIQSRELALRPNGIALEDQGAFLLAHLGTESGGIFRLFADGTVEPVLTEVGGTALPPSNFPCRDAEGRLWLTVSTRKVPRASDYRRDAASGFIVVMDHRGARIAADGLGYANELAISADGTQLFVNETFGRRLTRFSITSRGELVAPEVVARFGRGVFPDGLTLDEEGGIWITSIVSNRVIHIAPDGKQTVIVEEVDRAHLDWVEAAYEGDRMDRQHLDAVPARQLRNISSLAFGGPELRTAYLGCLLGDSLRAFPAPVRGLRPRHYDADISSLYTALDLK